MTDQWQLVPPKPNEEMSQAAFIEAGSPSEGVPFDEMWVAALKVAAGIPHPSSIVCTIEAQEVLAGIFENSERPDKISIIADPVSRTVHITYEDMDEEWFKEIVEALTK